MNYLDIDQRIAEGHWVRRTDAEKKRSQRAQISHSAKRRCAVCRARLAPEWPEGVCLLHDQRYLAQRERLMRIVE